MKSDPSSPRFPYGTFQPDPVFRERYRQTALADAYPLPAVLPLHHPLLRQLEGSVQITDAPGPWWPDCVASLHPAAHDLLSTIDVQEYRDGRIHADRWRAWKQQHASAFWVTAPTLASLRRRPRLQPVLQGTPWETLFQERGSSQTPEQLRLTISSQPQNLVTMSNGDGWTSCLRLPHGEYVYQLPSALFDTGLVVAFLGHVSASCWDPASLLARTTLRILRPGPVAPPVIAIGRVYGNNRTLEQWLLLYLIRRLEETGVPWGLLNDESLLALVQSGGIGAFWQRRDRQIQSMEGEPFWLPDRWYTLMVDGSTGWDAQGEHMVLHARVQTFLPAKGGSDDGR